MSEEVENGVKEEVLKLLGDYEIIHWVNMETEKEKYCEATHKMAIFIDYIKGLYNRRHAISKPVYLESLRMLMGNWAFTTRHIEDIMKELTRELYNNAIRFTTKKGKGFEAVIVDTIVKGIPSKSIHIAYPDTYICNKAEWIFAMKTPR